MVTRGKEGGGGGGGGGGQQGEREREREREREQRRWQEIQVVAEGGRKEKEGKW